MRFVLFVSFALSFFAFTSVNEAGEPNKLNEPSERFEPSTTSSVAATVQPAPASLSKTGLSNVQPSPAGHSNVVKPVSTIERLERAGLKIRSLPPVDEGHEDAAPSIDESGPGPIERPSRSAIKVRYGSGVIVRDARWNEPVVVTALHLLHRNGSHLLYLSPDRPTVAKVAAVDRVNDLALLVVSSEKPSNEDDVNDGDRAALIAELNERAIDFDGASFETSRTEGPSTDGSTSSKIWIVGVGVKGSTKRVEGERRANRRVIWRDGAFDAELTAVKADVRSGHSGGGAFEQSSGRLVGITVAKSNSDSSIGYVVPVERVDALLDRHRSTVAVGTR